MQAKYGKNSVVETNHIKPEKFDYREKLYAQEPMTEKQIDNIIRRKKIKSIIHLGSHTFYSKKIDIDLAIKFSLNEIGSIFDRAIKHKCKYFI